MTGIGWPLVDVVSRLLERDEREAVRGDLAETGVGAWRGLLDVLGLVVRREAAVWNSWRPWLAAFGLALPGSLLLMGFSLSVSWTYQQVITPKANAVDPRFVPFIWHILLLTGWSWTGGFVVGSVSRRTLWVSIASSCIPCLFCLARFREETLSRLCLLLFLVPAIWGVRQGLRVTRISRGSAIVLAVAITALMIPNWTGRGSWVLNLALIWPAWYMAATARSTTK